MRLVLCLSLAVLTAVLVYACGEAEEASLPESPGATTPAVSGSATPTAGPVAADTPTATAAPPSDTPTPTPTGAISLSTYEDANHGFSLEYPTGWTVTEPTVSIDQAELDVLKKVEFIAKDGLPRVRFFVYQNPDNLTLYDWIVEHNPIFFDTTPEEVTIGGQPGLFQPQGVEGPRPHAYVLTGPFVISFGGLTMEDYEAIETSIQFN